MKKESDTTDRLFKQLQMLSTGLTANGLAYFLCVQFVWQARIEFDTALAIDSEDDSQREQRIYWLEHCLIAWFSCWILIVVERVMSSVPICGSCIGIGLDVRSGIASFGR